MERQLNLIQGNYQEMEKRVLPRFPFSYLVFKEMSGVSQVFEVSDISYTGMQIQLKNGEFNYQIGQKISGIIQWRELTLSIEGEIKWVNQNRMGIKFNRDEVQKEAVRQFLSIENLVARIRPLHDRFFDVPLPNSLKYWLRADGPVEIFVWQHGGGEISKIQIILLDSFVEWESGKGMITGKLVNKRDLDTPLISEDEFMFSIDSISDEAKINFASEIISYLPVEYFEASDYDFIKFKIQA